MSDTKQVIAFKIKILHLGLCFAFPKLNSFHVMKLDRQVTGKSTKFALSSICLVLYTKPDIYTVISCRHST